MRRQQNKLTGRYHSRLSKHMYLQRRMASRHLVSRRDRRRVNNDSSTTDVRYSLAGNAVSTALRPSLFSSCRHARPGPSVVGEMLTTLVDNMVTLGLYLYASIQTEEGEMAATASATKTTQKCIQIDVRQKLVKCFNSEQKAIKTQMGLTYKEINFQITLFGTSSEV